MNAKRWIPQLKLRSKEGAKVTSLSTGSIVRVGEIQGRGTGASDVVANDPRRLRCCVRCALSDEIDIPLCCARPCV